MSINEPAAANHGSSCNPDNDYPEPSWQVGDEIRHRMPRETDASYETLNSVQAQRAWATTVHTNTRDCPSMQNRTMLSGGPRLGAFRTSTSSMDGAVFVRGESVFA